MGMTSVLREKSNPDLEADFRKDEVEALRATVRQLVQENEELRRENSELRWKKLEVCR